MLFCISEKMFNDNIVKQKAQFKELANDSQSCASKHVKLFNKIIGLEANGFINRKQAYAPLFERLKSSIPTTTNHSESFHHFLNDKIPNANTKLLTRVGMLAQKINERLQSVNESMTRNFVNYVENLKKKVHNKIAKDQRLISKYCEEQCCCHNSLYYSLLYEIDAPCIHTILNTKCRDKNAAKKSISGKEVLLPIVMNELEVIELDEILNFNEEKVAHTKNLISTNVDTIEKEYFDNIAQMIYECHQELNVIMSIDEFEICSIAMNIQELMLKDPIFVSMSEKDPDEYYAIMKVKIWKQAYIKKNMISQY